MNYPFLQKRTRLLNLIADQRHELVVRDFAVLIRIGCHHQLFNIIFGGILSQGSHNGFQLLASNESVLIFVKYLKSLSVLLFLIINVKRHSSYLLFR